MKLVWNLNSVTDPDRSILPDSRLVYCSRIDIFGNANALPGVPGEILKSDDPVIRFQAFGARFPPVTDSSFPDNAVTTASG